MIKREIELGQAAGLEHYRKAGEMLLEAKAQVEHGGWTTWLQRNFALNITTAQTHLKSGAHKTGPRPVLRRCG
jgi:Protein of unknown function (DUF3102)